MKTCSSSYSYAFCWKVVEAFYGCHTRETDFIAFYWHVTKDYIVQVFQKSQKAWNRFKILVKLTEKELTLHKIPKEAAATRIEAAASRIAYQYWVLTGKLLAPLDESFSLCSEMREKYYTKYGNIKALHGEILTRTD